MQGKATRFLARRVEMLARAKVQNLRINHKVEKEMIRNNK